MLGKDDVLDRIASGEIGISYEFDLVGGPTPTRLSQPASVEPGHPESVGYQTFERHFFGDRLALTLGPVVVSDRHPRLANRSLFKKRSWHFDLRASDNSIEIMPGESLLVNTIEYIALGGRTGAYVIPRLTLATAGLVVATTYIDPQWEGILQLYLTNLSRSSYRLVFGEKIAICRFYDVTGRAVPKEVKSRFAQKSHHYGQNWERVLDTDVETQPRRKRPVPAGVYFERARFGIATLLKTWHNIVGIALFGSLVTTIFAYATFQEKAAAIDTLKLQVSTLQTQTEQDRAALQRIARRATASGTSEIEIPAGQTAVSTRIKLNSEPQPDSEVWLFPVPANTSLTLKGTVGREQDSQTAILRIDLTDQSKPLDVTRSYTARWFVLPR